MYYRNRGSDPHFADVLAYDTGEPEASFAKHDLEVRRQMTPTERNLMDRTGNKRAVRQLLRYCREEFRANGCEDCGKLLELYKILVNMCRSARIIDDEGLCILGEHQDEWKSCAKGNEQLRHAVADWLNTLRDGLKGDDGVDVSSAFSKFCDVIAAGTLQNRKEKQ